MLSPRPRPPRRCPAFDGLGDELESVLESSDVIYAGLDDVSSQRAPLWALWDEVWAAQQLAGASEVYAVVGGDSGGGDEAAQVAHATEAAEAEAEAARGLASLLRRRFEDAAEWRGRAAERRAASDAAERARRLAAPTSTIGGAARSFGLQPADLDGCDEAFLKERWRQLALQAHPDVAGGSGERFQQLRAAYKVLLRAARPGGGGAPATPR